MRTLTALILTGGFLVAASLGIARQQGPGRDQGSRSADGDEDLVVRMMAFDSDKDGKLTKDEVTDKIAPNGGPPVHAKGSAGLVGLFVNPWKM